MIWIWLVLFAIDHARMYRWWSTISNANPRFRCIDIDRECLRQRWGSHRDQHYESGSLSASLECMTLMHKQSYINFLMIARNKRTYIMYVCPEDIFIWHVVITCLSVFACFHNVHEKERKWVGFISVLAEKFAQNVWNTHSQQPFADSLASLVLG